MFTKKKCFKCDKTKLLSEYYRHKEMSDGHLNKCKECTKKDVGKHRAGNIEKIREYDRCRGKLAHRIAESTTRTKEYRKKYPERYKANCIMNNSLRFGKVLKEPCVVCQTIKRLEAHHEDYSKPLDVWWLCSAHHSQLHHSERIIF